MTDTELKQLLAKMLPEWCEMEQEFLIWSKTDIENGIQKDNQVFGAQLLHLCSLAESALTESEYFLYKGWIAKIQDRESGESFDVKTQCVSATWQQRTEALAKVKGLK